MIKEKLGLLGGGEQWWSSRSRSRRRRNLRKSIGTTRSTHSFYYSDSSFAPLNIRELLWEDTTSTFVGPRYSHLMRGWGKRKYKHPKLSDHFWLFLHSAFTWLLETFDRFPESWPSWFWQLLLVFWCLRWRAGLGAACSAISLTSRFTPNIFVRLCCLSRPPFSSLL